MKLEALRLELKQDRAKAQFCPRCGGYGKMLGATVGTYTRASHCEGCDIVFGWARDFIPLPAPANEIELGDIITALNEEDGQVVNGQVVEIEIGRDILPVNGSSTMFVDRGPLNMRARIQFYALDFLGSRGLREAWVGLRGAFITQKSAIEPPDAT